MNLRIIIVLLFFSATGTSTAADFVTYQSGICTLNLQDYKLTKPVESGIVFGVSKILETYKDTFGFPYPQDFKVKVTIIGDKDKFKEYQVKQCGEVISETGYYSGMYHEAVVWKNKDTKTMLEVLFHEASHLILRHHIPWCPSWVNEGLSEYFEGFNVIGKNKRVFLQQNRHNWCTHWLKKGFPIEPGQYISLGYEEFMKFSKTDSNAAYTIGYSLVYFMMSRSSTEKVLKELLWEFKKQGKKADSVQTINRCYRGGFERFEKNWRRWLPKARSYRPLRALRNGAEEST